MSRSWIESANALNCDFPLQNLPYGVFRRSGEGLRCGVAIGDQVLDLAMLEASGILWPERRTRIFTQPSLNAFMALGPAEWAFVRRRLTALLARGQDEALRRDAALASRALAPIARVELALPIEVAGYTDFYASRWHAMNVGSMFRGRENALSANWMHMPIAYNGRASSIVVSGTPIRRPLGQSKPQGAAAPVFGPSRRLDFELEVGTVVGQASVLGQPFTVAEAQAKIFGYVLLNDWSARDIQAWEYQPLGPFQGKAFATSISPWVVTAAALEPFRAPAAQRQELLLPYLREPGPMHYDIALEAALRPRGAARATTITRTNFRHLYYAPAQMLAHHAVGGCKMEVGDLLGSGTISGPEKESFASLVELTWGGRDAITLETGETRTFLEDGDRLSLTGWAQGEGFRIGFGACAGEILPAVEDFP